MLFPVALSASSHPISVGVNIEFGGQTVVAKHVLPNPLVGCQKLGNDMVDREIIEFERSATVAANLPVRHIERITVRVFPI
jgi:hypothetical protein